jgi:hypothetical protein
MSNHILSLYKNFKKLCIEIPLVHAWRDGDALAVAVQINMALPWMRLCYIL